MRCSVWSSCTCWILMIPASLSLRIVLISHLTLCVAHIDVFLLLLFGSQSGCPFYMPVILIISMHMKHSAHFNANIKKIKSGRCSDCVCDDRLWLCWFCHLPELRILCFHTETLRFTETDSVKSSWGTCRRIVCVDRHSSHSLFSLFLEMNSSFELWFGWICRSSSSSPVRYLSDWVYIIIFCLW